MSTVRDARGQVGALLRRQLNAAGLSQKELADAAGLSRRGISELGRGVRRTSTPLRSAESTRAPTASSRASHSLPTASQTARRSTPTINRIYTANVASSSVSVAPAAQGGPLGAPFYLTFGNTNPATLAYDP